MTASSRIKDCAFIEICAPRSWGKAWFAEMIAKEIVKWRGSFVQVRSASNKRKTFGNPGAREWIGIYLRDFPGNIPLKKEELCSTQR